MIGHQDRLQEDLFVAAPLRDLIPDDHILKQLNRILDLSWLRKEVRSLYDEAQGRPSIDPEAALRLMLAGFFQGIVHDRKLMREAQVNLAIRWFAGYRLHEALPHHSSLTRIRQRWGADMFKRIFARTISSCAQAGLIDGTTVHVDATLIRADVSWESLSTAYAEDVITANSNEDNDPDGGGSPKRGRPRTKPAKPKKRSTTDPEATLTTSSKHERMEPCFKQHTAVDDKAGVIVDVAVTTGETSEGSQLSAQLDRIEANTQTKVETVTCDAGYAHGKNYAMLEERRIAAVIPPQAQPRRPKHIPLRLFKYDGRHQTVTCPAGRRLRRGSATRFGRTYHARSADCRNCVLRVRCFSPNATARTVLIVHGYEALLRARRWRQCWDEAARRWYRRHRWRVEGVHGEAKTQHGLRRAVRRGMDNVAIQVYLTAAVMNLKRLAAFACAALLPFAWPEQAHDVVTRFQLANVAPDATTQKLNRRAA
ncbi:MAG: transposase [Planctomycetes bacterium]|nr:transposase [Planctomycetota bacterium]